MSSEKITIDDASGFFSTIEIIADISKIMTENLSPELLLYAYQNGFFPMAATRAAREVGWYQPKQRGILPLDKAHIPTSFRKFLRKSPFHVTINQSFAEVIRHCAEYRDEKRLDTWINPEIEGAFTALHRQGYAHSVETRTQAGELVGGLYGVAIGGAFFGESMFSLRSGASKQALAFLINRLQEKNYGLLDTQYVNSHIAQFGVIEISAKAYAEMLQAALTRECVFI